MNTRNDNTSQLTRRLGVLAAALTIGLSGALAVVTLSASAAESYGSLSASSGVLPPSDRCGTYSYAYDVTPPPGDWALETTVTDPRGNAVSSYTVLSNYSPGGASSSTSYQLCTNYTVSGTFVVTGKLTVDNGAGIVTNYEVTPASFQLTDAPVAQKSRHKHKHRRHKHKRYHHR